MKINTLLLDPAPALMAASGGMPPMAVSAPLPPNTQVQTTPSVEQTNETDRPSLESQIAQAPVEAGTENLMEAFTQAAGKGFTNPPPTTAKPEGAKVSSDAEAKVAESPEGVQKTEEKPNTPVVPSTLPKISLEGKALPKARDYSDLPPEAQDMFRNMSNKAYETLKPIYLQHKQGMEVLKAKDLEIAALKTAAPQSISLPQSYLEHADAYTLTPDFQKAESQAQQLTTEYQHWATQLERIKRGEKWRALVTNAKGEVVQTEEQPFSPRAEEIVRQQMMSAHQLYNQNEQFIGSMAATHKAKVQQGQQMLKEIDETYFPFYKDWQNSPDKGIIEQSMKGLPEVYQQHPMALLLGKAYAALVRLHTSLQEATAGNPQAIAQSVVEDQKKAGPTGASINGAPAATPKADEDLMSKFNAMTQRN